MSSTGVVHRGGASAFSEAFLLLAVLFVGNDFVAVKYALEGIPPLVLMPLRFVLAGLVLVGMVGLIERRSRPKWKDLLPVAGVGVVGITLNHIGYTVGLSLTSGSDAALIFATAPVWGMVLGGAAALPFALTGVPGVSDSVFDVDWSAVGVRSWAGAAYSTFLASAFAIAAWQGSVARMGANKVLVYLYLVTLVGVTSSVLLLGEGLGAAKVAGAAVILLGVYVVRRD